MTDTAFNRHAYLLCSLGRKHSQSRVKNSMRPVRSLTSPESNTRLQASSWIEQSPLNWQSSHMAASERCRYSPGCHASRLSRSTVTACPDCRFPNILIGCALALMLPLGSGSRHSPDSGEHPSAQTGGRAKNYSVKSPPRFSRFFPRFFSFRKIREGKLFEPAGVPCKCAGRHCRGKERKHGNLGKKGGISACPRLSGQGGVTRRRQDGYFAAAAMAAFLALMRSASSRFPAIPMARITKKISNQTDSASFTALPPVGGP